MENPNQRACNAIEEIALRYLRNHFLLKNSNQAKGESKFLMKLLVDHEAIDLDVLADAFLHVRGDLEDETRNEYEDYILMVYREQRQIVDADLNRLRAEETSAVGEDKYKKLREVKNLERIAESCAYTKDVMGFE